MVHRKNTEAKLILVGAGPGDPELLTIKGFKALQSAGVILYDGLVNTKIFDLLSGKPELIFVGKRRGLKENSQEKINELILENLKAGKVVVRLKGGDPFIFARGVEEIKCANDHGYSAEIIPGLTSGLAVPVSLGIALTLRQKVDAIVLATAHDFSFEKLQEWAEILRSGKTLILYMGLFKIVEIVEGFTKYLPTNFPAIAVQDGTLETQKMVKSNLGEITQDIIDASLQAPVILIFGEHIEQNLVLAGLTPNLKMSRT